MNAARTSNELFITLAQIATAMKTAGLPEDFIAAALRTGDSDPGIADLMQMWAETSLPPEREAIVADIQELLDDTEDLSDGVKQRPRIPYEHLGNLLSSVQQHKQRLRDLIDRKGGVTEVARRAGIPQPSLSRMLNSGSMPRKATLYKLARALDVSEAEVIGEWTT